MSERPRLDAVLFDAGGTLVRLDFEWISERLAAHGIRVPSEALRRGEVEGRRRYDASRARPEVERDGPLGSGGDIDAYFSGMLDDAGAPPGCLRTIGPEIRARHQATGMWSRPLEGAREGVAGVRALGLRTAVVSNSDGRAEAHLQQAGVGDGFEFVVDSHRVGIEKPDPRIFALALGRLGLEPGCVLFVGDIRSVDEAGARAAGMPFVLIDPLGDYAGAASNGADGDPIRGAVRGPAELPGWIEERFETPGAPGARGGTHRNPGGKAS